jgi:DNA invertase Pin-like site-specific DNA recombinase
MLRAGLYARVSTNDQQTLPMQKRAMREYAARTRGRQRFDQLGRQLLVKY